MDNNLISEIKSILDPSQNILIVTKENPTTDNVAAALALWQTLSKSGKTVSVACPTPLTVEYTNLFSIDKVETKMGNKNLVISLDYVEGSIEKVSYNVNGDKFNLVIQPKAGFLPFSGEKVKFSNSGISANLIFVIGCQNLGELGNFYQDDKNSFENTPVINFNNISQTEEFGKINIIKAVSSCSQLILDFLQSFSLSPDPDMASNLLTGIESSTNGFKANVGADTFEAAALCLRMGAKRYFQPSELPPPVSPNSPSVSEQPVVVSPEPEIKKQETKSKPPPDWLQPKIYKGGQLI